MIFVHKQWSFLLEENKNVDLYKEFRLKKCQILKEWNTTGGNMLNKPTKHLLTVL